MVAGAMNKSEVAIVVILRVVGIGGLFAIPAIFLPFSWMNAIHQSAGLGELPDAPIVDYLPRSLSAAYAIISAMTLYVSFDIRRYRGFIQLWAIVVIAFGCAQLGIDLHAGLPLSWIIGEGPPTIVVGLIALWLQRNVSVTEKVEPE
jgi:hypothetical protein